MFRRCSKEYRMLQNNLGLIYTISLCSLHRTSVRPWGDIVCRQMVKNHLDLILGKRKGRTIAHVWTTISFYSGTMYLTKGTRKGGILHYIQALKIMLHFTRKHYIPIKEECNSLIFCQQYLILMSEIRGLKRSYLTMYKTI